MRNNSPIRLINLKSIPDHRGLLTVVGENQDIPFEIKRAYWIHSITPGATRGGHAHKKQKQLIVAVAGSFSVTLDDGNTKESFLLNDPAVGLYVEAGIWNTLDSFSSDAVCMVLASDTFSEEDYIRDYQEFLDLRNSDTTFL